jgi:hypothetical protein
MRTCWSHFYGSQVRHFARMTRPYFLWGGGGDWPVYVNVRNMKRKYPCSYIEQRKPGNCVLEESTTFVTNCQKCFLSVTVFHSTHSFLCIIYTRCKSDA